MERSGKDRSATDQDCVCVCDVCDLCDVCVCVCVHARVRAFALTFFIKFEIMPKDANLVPFLSFFDFCKERADTPAHKKKSRYSNKQLERAAILLHIIACLLLIFTYF